MTNFLEFSGLEKDPMADKLRGASSDVGPKTSSWEDYATWDTGEIDYQSGQWENTNKALKNPRNFGNETGDLSELSPANIRAWQFETSME